MRQEGTLTVRKGQKKVKVMLDQVMPDDKYSVAVSVLDPQNSKIICEVPFETKEDFEFVIVFREKLTQKISIHWSAEKLS